MSDLVVVDKTSMLLKEAVAASWGERVARRREALHYTQAQLAAAVGLAPNSIARIERGEQHPRLDTMLDIAGALRCYPSDLFPLPKQVPPVPQGSAA